MIFPKKVKPPLDIKMSSPMKSLLKLFGEHMQVSIWSYKTILSFKTSNRSNINKWWSCCPLPRICNRSTWTWTSHRIYDRRWSLYSCKTTSGRRRIKFVLPKFFNIGGIENPYFVFGQPIAKLTDGQQLAFITARRAHFERIEKRTQTQEETIIVRSDRTPVFTLEHLLNYQEHLKKNAIS